VQTVAAAAGEDAAKFSRETTCHGHHGLAVWFDGFLEAAKQQGVDAPFTKEWVSKLNITKV
jgi:hypothetical protein